MSTDVSDKPMRLSDDDAAYHSSLVGQVKDAQEAQDRIARTQAAWDNWAEYLKSKYGFTDGDVITEEGMIVYGEPPLNGSLIPDG
jgi:hypothetical protein